MINTISAYYRRCNNIVMKYIDTLKTVSVSITMTEMFYECTNRRGRTITIYIHDNTKNGNTIIFNRTIAEHNDEDVNKKIFNEFKNILKEVNERPIQ